MSYQIDDAYQKGDSFPVDEPGPPKLAAKLGRNRERDDWKERAFFGALGQLVFSVDRESGQVIWEWKVPKSGGVIQLLLDEDRLIVSAGGYLYCLDPNNGRVLWDNPLRGKGIGPMTMVSPRGDTAPVPPVPPYA